MVSSGQHYSYDEVPYPDLSYVQTHPSRLAMLGILLGMNPAPVEQCRVLEIGSAAGGNLLPMAAVLPNSTFVGIDLSIVQIEQAQAAVEAVGMINIRFQQMDILNITPEFGQFDYIIAHGIYSWVPPVVQDKLLEVCQQNLAPQGIAYISYNTYPGWHRMDIIRNMMLYRTRNAATPAEKVTQATQWVSFMADALKGQPESAYAAVFEDYVSFRLAQTEGIDHTALIHDELEANNTPVYFHQFIERAEQHGLQYLVESDFSTVMPNGLSDEVREYLSQIAHSAVEMEQYFDFLRERMFRRTLLCHAEIEVDRRLSIQPLSQFYVSSAAHTVKPDADQEAKGIEIFEGADGIAFKTYHLLTKAAFNYLIDVRPLRIPFDRLVREAASRLNMTHITDQEVAGLAGNLLRAFAHSLDLVEFHSFAPQMTTTVSERPITTAFARYQVRQRSHIGTLVHGRASLDNFSRLVLAQLDGHNDRAALLDFLVELAEAGKISMPAGVQMPTTPDEMRSTLADELDRTLDSLAHLALLVA